jgi:hypothetical protein
MLGIILCVDTLAIAEGLALATNTDTVRAGSAATRDIARPAMRGVRLGVGADCGASAKSCIGGAEGWVVCGAFAYAIHAALVGAASLVTSAAVAEVICDIDALIATKGMIGARALALSVLAGGAAGTNHAASSTVLAIAARLSIYTGQLTRKTHA